jgi:predicted CoA-binding protein
MTTDAELRAILLDTRRIAVVGASNKLERPSYSVMQALLAHGYEVVPVNPGLAGQAILGQPVVATLAEAAPLDMVDVFRASDAVGPVMQDAIRLGAKTVWMQIGVANEAAARLGREAGLRLVMDRCPKIELGRLQTASRAMAVL